MISLVSIGGYLGDLSGLYWMVFGDLEIMGSSSAGPYCRKDRW